MVIQRGKDPTFNMDFVPRSLECWLDSKIPDSVLEISVDDITCLLIYGTTKHKVEIPDCRNPST